MKVASTQPVHLTYCTNIHPGESWAEIFQNLQTHVLEVKRRVSPDEPFGVGLRLSNAAALTLTRPEAISGLARFLEDNGLYVFTINGFPYGPFHGQPVKEQVYRPDWLEEERLTYTDHLAHILATLLPRNKKALGHLEGSISTVPGCFRGRAAADGNALATMAERLVRQAGTLARIALEGGPTIGLALEPEPHCVLETTDELVRFFEQHLFADRAVRQMSELVGTESGRAADLLRRHLGICLDACHAAVEYESPSEVVRALDRSGVRVLKIQVTTGLRLARPDDAAMVKLRQFAEGTYLHQTVVRRGKTLIRHLDLGDALAAAHAPGPPDLGDEWRIHFHVPIFQADLRTVHEGFENTHDFLDELLQIQATDPLTSHLEVETYTWDVLPEALRALPVHEAIARELAYAKKRVQEPPPI